MVDRGKLLVAYEMGLGKTPMTIAAIETLRDKGLANNGIVVGIASVKYQWAKEIKKFSDASVLVVDGTPLQRKSQYAEAANYNYVILNYEQVVNDWGYVSKLPRDFVVCDEVTAIKSFKAKRSRRVKRLQTEYLFGLSGQPIENKPEEVYSIMQWIDTSVLGRFDLFDKTFIVRNGFGGVQYYKNLPTFHKALTEAMVRKTQKDPDVAPYMPKVSEQNRYVEFDTAGKRLYKRIAKELLADLAAAQDKFGANFDVMSHYTGQEDPAANAMRGMIMSKLTCLRMLCDDGSMLRLSASRYEKVQAGLAGVSGGSAYAHELEQAGVLAGITRSPKIDATIELIQEILDASPDNKIVVFSFFTPTLNVLQERTQGFTGSVQFKGSMDAKQRDTAKEKFQEDKHCRLFLSSDAGGYGVDLPNANYLINIDLPWSSGRLVQRNSRIIRTSSEFKNVNLINMLMQGSIEERQYDMLVSKKAIASAILDGKGIDTEGKLTLNLKTLTTFLQTTEL